MQGTSIIQREIKKRNRLNLPEQLHNIVEVNSPVIIEIKRTDWFMCRNPLHLVEVQDDISKVQPAVGVQVFVEAVPIGISWWV